MHCTIQISLIDSLYNLYIKTEKNIMNIIINSSTVNVSLNKLG